MCNMTMLAYSNIVTNVKHRTISTLGSGNYLYIEVQEGIPKILFPKTTFAKVAKLSWTKTYGEVLFLAQLQYRSLSYKTCSNN